MPQIKVNKNFIKFSSNKIRKFLDEDSRANTHMIIETILQRQLVTDQNQTIVQERNDTDDFNLENEPSSEPSDIKKGKSNALPEEVSTIYAVIKEYYEKLPAIFRLDGIRKKQKTHFYIGIDFCSLTLLILVLNSKFM